MPLGLIAAAALLVGAVFGAARAADVDTQPDRETAALTVGPMTGPGVQALPRVLSSADVTRYRRIMAYQDQANWRAADREIARLDDRILMGHVLAQRYLAPRGYRTRFDELRDWLGQYADHPDAPTIHKLALSRKPRNARAPQNADYQRATVGSIASVPIEFRSTAAERHWARHREVAADHFFDGRFGNALRTASAITEKAPGEVLSAEWIAGLAAYRLNEAERAAGHFAAIANSKDAIAMTRARAAFWAARSHMIGGRPNAVSGWLKRAADERQTFYGQLARRILGLGPDLSFDAPVLTAERAKRLTTEPAARRALALIEVGRVGRAESELRGIGGEQPLTEALAALAAREGMVSVAISAGSRLAEMAPGQYQGIMYPVPAWEPKGGFALDRALIFAFMRQESAFNPRAVSSAGARGLMQLMPATAGYMAGRSFAGDNREELFDPALNMALGQKYLRYLLDNEEVKGDLLLTAIAYNGGPGNLAKWRKRANVIDDPLLFIESIPARETRLFVEHVLANLWIYQMRMGLPTPSLDALARGERPVYKPVEEQRVRVVRNARD